MGDFRAIAGFVILAFIYWGFILAGRHDLGWRGILAYGIAWIAVVLCMTYEVFTVFIVIPAFFLLYCILALHVLGYNPRVR